MANFIRLKQLDTAEISGYIDQVTATNSFNYLVNNFSYFSGNFTLSNNYLNLVDYISGVTGTLPNIVNGETSIRNRFQGENTFFVADRSRKGEILEEMKEMALGTGLSLLVTGWCEYFAGKYEINFKLFKKERYGN